MDSLHPAGNGDRDAASPEHRWDQIQSVFRMAAETPPDERQALVERLCGADAHVRDEVLSLLKHERDVQAGFLKPASLDVAARFQRLADRPDHLIGRQIDGYRITSVIASGGMGVVYLAEQENPRRLVAVKLLRSGIASPAALRRFEHETRLLARLQHPNIAQVYQAGIATVEGDGHGGVGPVGADGLAGEAPYFAMEYVPDAATLTDYAEQHNLDLANRLALFLQACDAVEHGHQKGVIHRDLKPANILVRGQAPRHVKVIDFGIARSTDADVARTTMRTETGQILGTLQYMSPEQCAGDSHDIDTRSDVYSLGVVLYELMCRRLPYDVTRSTVHSAIKAICEVEPTRPSVFDRRLRGNLETILLKALEKDRTRRYQGVADLARDIRRHLTGEPILAQPPGLWQRMLHWVARHPVLATSGLCALLVLGTAITTGIGYVYFKRRPARLLPTGGTGGYCLYSATGSTLKSWCPPNYPRIDLNATILDAHDSAFGVERIIVLGFKMEASHPFGGRLVVFDADGDLDVPLWQDGVEREDFPNKVREWSKRDGRADLPWEVGWFFVADVFAENPGQEIIAHFCYKYSQRPIRIYALSGELLYEVWYDGEARNAVWLEGAKLLVCTGTFNDFKLDDPAAFEHFGGSAAPPHVVFALKPRFKRISNEFLRTKPGKGPLDPVWFYWIKLPLPVSKDVHSFVSGDRPCANKGPKFELSVRFSKDDDYVPTLSWDFNSDGECLSAQPTPSDAYQKNRAELPDPEEIEFVPLPEDIPPFPGPEPPKHLKPQPRARLG